MKKMTILAVILALAIALTACGSEKAPETTTAAEVAATVPAETAALAQPLELTDWVMTANTWSSPNGATINISATPNHYEEGQKADFVVRLESDEIASVPGQWDGTSYTASVDLNAANGYCYYVVLTAADGTTAEVAVNTPTAPTNEALINMEASLESYCTVIIEESEFNGSKLTLTNCKAQIKTPAITNEGETISCQDATLVLNCNGTLSELPVTNFEETDTACLYEADLSGTIFDLPAMQADQSIELSLNVTLSNGQNLNSYGGNWVYNDNSLLPVVG